MINVLIIAIISGIILYKLYTMLGQDDNHDMDLSYPGKKNSIIDVTPEPVSLKTLKNIPITEPTSPSLKAIIDQILTYDPSFSEETFLKGAKRAFEMILEAFSKGDYNTLNSLLAEDVLKEFSTNINQRSVDGFFPESTLVSILETNILSANINRSLVEVKLKFISEQINVIRDKDGKILKGNPSQIDHVEDNWTFSRDLRSSDPTWKLIATNDI